MMKMILILPIVFHFLNIYPVPVVESTVSDSNDTLFIHLIKLRWHTGIVFEIKHVDTSIWKEINEFNNVNYLDVGWGDEEFYQYPGFDAGLAIKALFYPTPSTLRIEGFSFDIKKYVEISDLAIKIPVTQSQFDILTKHVRNTYYFNLNNSVEILSEQYNGNIKFYRAKGKYHLFNTCNTWIAQGLKEAGFNINPSGIILAEDLFAAADDFGLIVKSKGQ